MRSRGLKRGEMLVRPQIPSLAQGAGGSKQAPSKAAPSASGTRGAPTATTTAQQRDERGKVMTVGTSCFMDIERMIVPLSTLADGTASSSSSTRRILPPPRLASSSSSSSSSWCCTATSSSESSGLRVGFEQLPIFKALLRQGQQEQQQEEERQHHLLSSSSAMMMASSPHSTASLSSDDSPHLTPHTDDDDDEEEGEGTTCGGQCSGDDEVKVPQPPSSACHQGQPMAPPPRPPPPPPSQQQQQDAWSLGRVSSRRRQRYQLGHRIGYGAYGEVVEAWDRLEQRRVAIKRMTDPCRNATDAHRVYRELCILRRLPRHPNIVALLDVFVTGAKEDDDENEEEDEGCSPASSSSSSSSCYLFKDLFLVFELADTDMYKLTRSPQFLTDAHIRVFMHHCLSGLAYLQTAGIVHRDLKPANLLINSDCSLKIADFGLACCISSHELNNNNHTSASPPASKQPPPGRPGHLPPRPPTGVLRPPAPPTPAAATAVTKEEVEVMELPARLDRQLTTHVMTRWYRAPEVILHERYDEAVDIWSLGCILAELLGMQAKAVEHRSPLLPGVSCIGMSPSAAAAASRAAAAAAAAQKKKPQQPPACSGSSASGQQQQQPVDVWSRLCCQDDQMGKILRLLGPPCAEDLEWLGPRQQHYLRTCHFPHSGAGVPLPSIFPTANPDALALLQAMLAFNPHKRITVAQALAHPYFQDGEHQQHQDYYQAAAAAATRPQQPPEAAAGGGGETWPRRVAAGQEEEDMRTRMMKEEDEDMDCTHMSARDIKARIYLEVLHAANNHTTTTTTTTSSTTTGTKRKEKSPPTDYYHHHRQSYA